MGNKNATSSDKDVIKSPNFNAIPSTEDLIPSSTSGYRLDKDPVTIKLILECPTCRRVNNDNGLEMPLICNYCSCIFMSRGDQLQILNQTSTEIIEPLIKPYPPFSVDHLSISNIGHFVVTVMTETVPNEHKNDDKVNFGSLAKTLLLPFFLNRMRLISRGCIFKTKNVVFKVHSCEPEFGKVTKGSILHLYKESKLSTPLVKVVVGASNSNRINIVTSQHMKYHFQLNNYLNHLEIDQTLVVNSCELSVSYANPSGGKITPETIIEIERERIGEVKEMIINCFHDQIQWLMSRRTGISDLDQCITKKIIKPYFQGVKRIAEKNSSFQIDGCEFIICDCEPMRGYVGRETIIRCESLPSKKIFTAKQIREDRNLAKKLQMQVSTTQDGRSGQTNNRQRTLLGLEDLIQQRLNQEMMEEEKSSYSPYSTGNDTSGQLRVNPTQATRTMMPNLGVDERQRSSSLLNSGSSPNRQPSSPIPDEHTHIHNSYLQRQLNNHQDNYNTENRLIPETRPMRNLPFASVTFDNVNNPQYHRNTVLINNDNNEMPLDMGNDLINLLMQLGQGPGMGMVLRPSQRVENKGASRVQINRLPERTIEQRFVDDKSLHEDLKKCHICLLEYERGDKARTLPCMHFFHKDCIDSWLNKNKTCPICKTNCDADVKYD
jgi:hypothetical protein